VVFLPSASLVVYTLKHIRKPLFSFSGSLIHCCLTDDKTLNGCKWHTAQWQGKDMTKT